VAQPASKARTEPEEAPPIDPGFVELRYRYHRARRQRRVNRRQETRLARYRFYVVLGTLMALVVAFLVASWHEIQHLFGI
jgi:hypothetical protein